MFEWLVGEEMSEINGILQMYKWIVHKINRLRSWKSDHERFPSKIGC